MLISTSLQMFPLLSSLQEVPWYLWKRIWFVSLTILVKALGELPARNAFLLKATP